MAVGLKEIREGPSCLSCSLPTPAIYHIPTLSACSIRGLLARERRPLGGGRSELTTAGGASNKVEVQKLPLAPEGRKMLRSGGMAHGGR